MSGISHISIVVEETMARLRKQKRQFYTGKLYLMKKSPHFFCSFVREVGPRVICLKNRTKSSVSN